MVGETIRQLFARGARGWCCEENGAIKAFVVTERTRLDEPVMHFAWYDPDKSAVAFLDDLWRAAGVDPGSHFFYTFRTKDCTGPLWANGRWCPEIARRRDP